MVNTLDKEEFRIKLEEINHLVEKKDYKGALEVVDSIDWRKVKNPRILRTVGEIYASNKKYEESKEILLLAYHRAGIGKDILHRLIEISLKMKDVSEAEEFYEEYMRVAPNDRGQYTLLYQILKAKGAPIEEQIHALEEYKEKEFTEKWSLELAKLYEKAGEKEKCIDLCSTMILWFSEGKYVERALELKAHFGALTEEEKKKYHGIPVGPEEIDVLKKNLEEEDSQNHSEYEFEEDSKNIDPIKIEKQQEPDLMAIDENKTGFQEKISKSFKELFAKKKEKKEEDDFFYSEKESISSQMNIVHGKKEEDSDDIPQLEPEIVDHFGENKAAEKKFSQEEEEETSIFEFKQPDPHKVPPVSKTTSLPDPELIREIMNEKKYAEEAAAAKVSEEPYQEEEKDSLEFNLEDSILAAASAQGITFDQPENEDDFSSEAPEEFEDDVEELKKEIEKLEPEFSDELSEEEQMEEAQEVAFQEESSREESPELKKFSEQIQKILDEKNEPLTEEEELENFIDSKNDQWEISSGGIVPRKRKLTEEEEKLFSYFVKVPGMKEQLLDMLEDMQDSAADKTSKTGNIIVMGARYTGKTHLISSIIPAVCRELHMEAVKVAYVFAEQINGKDIAKIISKVSGGFLVIENANQMIQETADQLNQAMEFRTDGLTVILEDEKIGMRKFMARYPKLSKKFTSMINIPVFTNDELVNFAKVYTQEKGYSIDQMALLALYNLISQNQKEDEPMTIGAVKEMIDNAIAKSQGGMRKLKRNFSKKRHSVDGMIVLYENDFS